MVRPETGTAVHGGPDALGVAPFDFSTNSNACGPCPAAQAALIAADAAHYPDPAYTSLRVALASWHGVAPERIVMAASASEFIVRMTTFVALQERGASVWTPDHAYGDYARSALAHGLPRADGPASARLLWLADPDSPFGRSDIDWSLWSSAMRDDQILVLDRAYEPLRLSGESGLDAAFSQRLWQVWTPNKALGLTGVRAAYAIAPVHQQDIAARLGQLASSWPIGAHGAALLSVWVTPEAQHWLQQSLATLRQWKARQMGICAGLGWQVEEGVANFTLVRTAGMARLVAALRPRGIKLRDASSFGLVDAARLGVLPPEAQDELQMAARSNPAPHN